MDTGFFIIAKIVGAFLLVETWLVLALVAVMVALLRQRYRTALWITSGTMLSVVVLSAFPLADPLLAKIEQTYSANSAPERVDGIIVLGCGGDLYVSRRWGRPELSEGGDRYVATLALARKYPEAVIVFTGGSGALRDALSTAKSESDLAREFFAAHVLPSAPFCAAVPLRVGMSSQANARSLAVWGDCLPLALDHGVWPKAALLHKAVWF